MIARKKQRGFLLNPYRFGAVVDAWNPADKNANVTLSNGNKTATNPSGTAARVVRSVVSKNTGKFYVECVASSFVSTMGFGFATSGAALTTYLGSTSTGWGFWGNYSTDQRAYNNNALTAYAGNFATASVIGLAIDLDAGKAWWSRGGTYQGGDPAAGTGQMATFTGGTTIFLACDPFGSGGAWTLRPSSSEHSYSPPSGFTAGWIA